MGKKGKWVGVKRKFPTSIRFCIIHVNYENASPLFDQSIIPYVNPQRCNFLLKNVI